MGTELCNGWNNRIDYRQIYESMMDAFAQVDMTGRITGCNRVFEEMLGYTLEELQQLTYPDLTPARWHNMEERLIREQVLVCGYSQVYEKEYVRKDGSHIAVELRTFALRDERGEPYAMWAIVRDISARKLIEKELEQSRRHLKTVTDNIPVFIAHCGVDKCYLYVNRAYAALFGREQEEFIGKHPRTILGEAVYAQAEPYMDKALSGMHAEFEIALPSTAAGIRVINVIYSPELDRQGKTIGFIVAFTDITSRKQMEEELRRSEERYRTVVEDQTEVISRMLANGTLIFVNDVFCRFFGKRREDLVGHLWHPEAVADDIPLVEAQLRTMSPVTPVVIIENRVHSGTGEVRWMQFVNRGFFDSEGKLLEIQSVGRDITSRKDYEIRLQKALAEAARFRKALDHVSAYVYMKDTGSRYIYANQTTLELFGCAAETLAGCDDTRFFPPDTVQKLREVDARVFQGECTAEEIEVMEASGQRRVYWEVKTPIYEENEETALGLLGISTDITQRKLMEETLRNQASLLDLTRDSIMVRDMDDRITYWNRGAMAQYGWTVQEALGTVIHELLATMFPAPLGEIKSSLFLTGYWEGMLTHTRKDGSLVTVASRWALQKDEHGQPRAIMEINNDITDKLHLEEHERNLQKLESLGILAGGIAHDFNNLLTVIMGNIAMVRMHGEVSENLQGTLSRAEEACIHASQLSRQLLTFTKGGAPIKKYQQIGRLLHDAVEFSLSGSNVRGEYSIPSDLPLLAIDEGQLRQVFSNLGINAKEAMADGGVLTVVAEATSLLEQNSFALPPGPYVKISFTDQGHGIPRDIIGRIFDPYYSTKEMGSRKGQGLGLTICHSIIGKHGGTITAASRPGEGSTFIILLPAAWGDVPVALPDRSDDTTLEAPGSGQRILVVDDEEELRTLLTQMLQQFGFRVMTTDNVKTAIESYQSALKKDPFGAVILDLTIAGGSGGLHAIEELRKIDPQVRGIITSGYATNPIMTRFRDYGFVAAMVKPFSVATLKQTLAALFSKKTQ